MGFTGRSPCGVRVSPGTKTTDGDRGDVSGGEDDGGDFSGGGDLAGGGGIGFCCGRGVGFPWKKEKDEG